MPAVDTYTPEPNLLERKFADYLAQHCAKQGAADHPSAVRIAQIRRTTRWVIALSALAGVISGGLIGGSEIWMRQNMLDGMDATDWRETWRYWSVFYILVGVVSAVEIGLLYAIALRGVARVAYHSGLSITHDAGRMLFAHSLARTALEFPSPQVRIYGIDPYAHVANWKRTALNIAYKLKVGVSSFVLRVFLRRLVARTAIRSMVPLLAGPLYAVWNAYIIGRIMSEAQVRTLGPFAVDMLIKSHFKDATALPAQERDVVLHAAGEMLTRGQDAHPNQVYLLNELRIALNHRADVALDWSTMRCHLPDLDVAGQARVLDVLTVSCLIGKRMRREQMALLRDACNDCNTALSEARLKALRKAFKRGKALTRAQVADTRS